MAKSTKTSKKGKTPAKSAKKPVKATTKKKNDKATGLMAQTVAALKKILKAAGIKVRGSEERSEDLRQRAKVASEASCLVLFYIIR